MGKLLYFYTVVSEMLTTALLPTCRAAKCHALSVTVTRLEPFSRHTPHLTFLSHIFPYSTLDILHVTSACGSLERRKVISHLRNVSYMVILKNRHFPSFVPFIYTQIENSPLKTIISKNSGQSGDFGKLWLHICMQIEENSFRQPT